MKTRHHVKKRLAKKLGMLWPEEEDKVFRAKSGMTGWPKVGEVLHDCNGFNHIVSRIEPIYIFRHGARRKILYGFETYYLHPEGYETCFCGCTGTLRKLPAKPEEITKYINSICENLADIDMYGKYFHNTVQRSLQKLAVCDEFGCPISLQA